MRSGRLLAEESPQVLLSMYGCQSLEEVFLKLSRKQGENTVQDANLTNNISLVNSFVLFPLVSLIVKNLDSLIMIF